MSGNTGSGQRSQDLLPVSSSPVAVQVLKRMSSGNIENMEIPTTIIPPGPNKVVLSTGGAGAADPEDMSSFNRNYDATHSAGISHVEMVNGYSVWADNYDTDLCPGRYNGPSIAADAMAEHYPDEDVREQLRILDVAAGTGRVGHELYKVGFKHIDALEPSEGMLSVLQGRNIYGVIFQESIGYSIIDAISPDSYDCLVTSGGMGEGHIPVSAMDEMIRIVKPGGTVFIVMREAYLNEVKEYVDKFEPYMKALEEKGLWKQIGRTVVKNYSFDNDGVVFKYEIA